MEYKASLAVRTGRYHEAQGVLCQDRAEVFRENGTVCAALADGAGSRASSHVGAACVTHHISRLVCREFEELWAMADGPLARYLTESCIRELSRQKQPTNDLACTLLFFAGRPDGRFLSGHLGDGIQIRITGGTASVFSPPENGDYQNETYFITTEDAASRLRLRRGILPPSGALLMMSDGMAESLYQRDTATPAAACLRMASWLQEGEEDVISQALAENMDRVFSRHSRDDLSLVILAWEEKD